jgi:CRISPR-associated Csx2 family protein
MKTLVSFIGAGRRQEGEQNTYQKTTYQFPDQSTFETALFPEALIHRKEMDIGECVLIGTHGSSWGCLIEEAALDNSNLFSLYETLENQFDQNWVEGKTLVQLEQELEKLWGIPVQCHLHASEICEDNVLPILFGYVNALNQTPAVELLIDITHGFRSMPVLLMAAIQTLDAMAPAGIDLEIIYGELKKGEASPVRYLKPVWDGVRFARAMRLFNERFDGELLSEFLETDWPAGAKAVERIGNMIQANFFTKFDEALRQLGNALEGFPATSDTPELLLSKELLGQVHQQLSFPKSFHQKLLVLAEMLADRRLYGQAVTTLQLAMEAFVFSYFEDNGYGDYERTKELLGEFSNTLTKRDRNHFHQLRNARNTIAHGGCRSAKGGIPQETNLPGQFKTYRDFLKRIF